MLTLQDYLVNNLLNFIENNSIFTIVNIKFI